MCQQMQNVIFRASKKYGSWDPEVVNVTVGDYGRITRAGKVGSGILEEEAGDFSEGRKYLRGRTSGEI